MPKFEVVVSNIGTIPCETDKEAEDLFLEYVEMSKSPHGNASGEDVTLLIDGEPIKEHFGSNRRDE